MGLEESYRFVPKVYSKNAQDVFDSAWLQRYSILDTENNISE
jgi:hypothetical protein